MGALASVWPQLTVALANWSAAVAYSRAVKTPRSVFGFGAYFASDSAFEYAEPAPAYFAFVGERLEVLLPDLLPVGGDGLVDLGTRGRDGHQAPTDQDPEEDGDEQLPHRST